MDHRGRPAFPGLVLNIISDEYLKANNLKEAGDDIPSSCVGVLYHIPEAATQATVEELDFRERGGYQRHIVTVKLLEDTHMHKIGDFVDVLVYIGSADNPNFTYDPSEEWYDRKVNIISAAYGPSGTNRDYLFPLVQFLHKNKYEDPYLYQLEQSVRMRLGRWKGRVGAETPPEALAESVNLWGWGSMEYGQMSLSSSLICKETLHNIYGAAVIGTLTISGPPKPFRFVALAGGSHSGCIVDDCLYLWGNQIHGQVGPGRLNCGVVGASLGHEHSVVLCNSGAVIAFGDDSYAQCSGGREAAPYFLKYMTSWPSPMLGFDILGEYNVDAMACWEQLQCNYAGLCHDLPKVIQVCAGVKHSAAITEDGHVYTWGGGRHARLLLSSAEPWRPLAGEDTASGLLTVCTLLICIAQTRRGLWL